MQPQQNRILRKKQVSELLGVSIATIDRLVANKEFIRPVKLSRQAVGFDEAELAAWIESRKADLPN